MFPPSKLLKIPPSKNYNFTYVPKNKGATSSSNNEDLRMTSEIPVRCYIAITENKRKNEDKDLSNEDTD